MTTHPGVYNCGGSNINCLNTFNGIRLRSPYSFVHGFSVNSQTPSGGFGASLDEGYTYGSSIRDGFIKGTVDGVKIDGDDTSSVRSTIMGNCVVSNITAVECITGLNVYAQSATSNPINLVTDGVTAIRCTGQGIKVGSYNNSVTLLNTTCIGPFLAGSRAGIEYQGNLTGLTIDGLKSIQMADIYGVRGPSTSTFITDTVTFPSGNAEGKLSFTNIKFVGQTSGYENTGVISDSSAFYKNYSAIDYSVKIGALVAKNLHGSVTDDLIQAQDSSGTIVSSIALSGKCDGTTPASVKAAIAGAADLAALKTALAGWFV
jgi:hypothetical protein